MSTPEEQAFAKVMQMRAMRKQAMSTNYFSGNPRVFNQAWDVYQRPLLQLTDKPVPGFGSHLKNVFTGTGKQLGHYAQALTFGHNGHRGAMENLFMHPIQNTVRFASDPAYRKSVHLSDIPKALWKDVSMPFHYAQPQLQQAWSETGGLGGYLMGKAQEPYYLLKNVFNRPVDY